MNCHPSISGVHGLSRLTLDAARMSWVGYAMNHLDLLSSPEVYGKLREWLGD